MKKFFICLISCFSIFTLCSATSTVEDVYLNRYAILVNGQKYSSTLPLLNYQGRTYLPLNEFGSMTGNDVSFSNNTISVNQHNSTQKYQELFLVSSLLHNMNKSITASSTFYHDCYDDYYLTYIDKQLGGGFRNSKEALDTAVDSTNSYYDSKDLITDICIEYNLATSKELNKLFENIKYYPLFLQQCVENMNLQLTYNLDSIDYSEEMALCNSGLIDITNSLNKIQSNISNAILSQT